MQSRLLLLLVACAVFLCGCGKPREIPGGTPGTVHVDGTPLSDVHVTAYLVTGADAADIPSVASGISDRDGRFVLRQGESLEAVWLEPGEYRFTVESVGEIPLIWPPEYGNPHDTPLRRTWESSEEELDLNVPEPRSVP